MTMMAQRMLMLFGSFLGVGPADGFLPNPHAHRGSSWGVLPGQSERLREHKFLRPSASTIRLPMADDNDDQDAEVAQLFSMDGQFDISTALFCGGLAFDSYVEPPANSSRWEKGSKGLKVAFVSPAYTRSLYKGIVEVTVHKVTGLPEDDNNMERLMTGSGVDACVLTAAVEGSWKEDVKRLEQEIYHEGVLDLSGAAHVVRTSTAWANIDEKESKAAKKRRGWAAPYHIPSTWGKGGQAIWPEENPLFIYVQDPATVRLVFTVLDADRIGDGKPIGSTYKLLPRIIPQAALNQEQLFESLKAEMLEAVKRGELDLLDETSKIQLGAKSWSGELRLSSKPRKKDKNSQMLAGAAAGAMLAGPVGAAAGAFMASYYEGQIQGTIHLRLRYLPFPQTNPPRKVYEVKGGTPGVDWGNLFVQHRNSQKKQMDYDATYAKLLEDVGDLEHCFFVNHDKTGATCAVYRSLKQRLIVVSFRGTCAPIDLLTDASLVQETWVEGEDVENQDLPKVHAGFRGSLASISRRLKELILATVAPGERLRDYDMLVTGHSLGGALATLFTADIAEYGVDAGRGLPQLEESEPWWKSIANTITGQQAIAEQRDPPRPKTLRVYSFGSPRVGNPAFAELFGRLLEEGHMNEAYRIVNGEDVVARMPRTLNALVLGQVRYDHCGPTVLISQPPDAEDGEGAAEEANEEDAPAPPLIWVEGESDQSDCPVRDGASFSNPVAEGGLLSEMITATKQSWETQQEGSLTDKLSSAFGQFTNRLKTVTAGDLGSVLGIEKKFTERELKMLQAVFQGKALAHHMEDQYYQGMGRAGGFLALVGEDLVALEPEVEAGEAEEAGEPQEEEAASPREEVP